MKLARDLDNLVDITSDRLAKTVIAAINHLTEESRPYGWDKMNAEQQWQEYALIRGSLDAWYRYIDDKAQGLMQRLKERGISEDKILAIRPYELALEAAITWSAEMEQKATKRNGRSNHAVPA